MNENCVPIYRVRRLPDGAGNCDAFGGLFFFPSPLPPAAALCCQHFKLFKQSAGGASEHLKCDLACESTQTALVEIRLVEHDWSQTSNLRSLAASRGTDSPRWAPTKEDFLLCSPAATYLIPAGEHRRVVLFVVEEVVFSLTF